MRPLYALTFQIDGDRIDELRTEIADWLKRKYRRWNRSLSDEGEPIDLGKPDHTAEFEWEDLPVGRMFTFRLKHPDWQTDGLTWHTAITVATEGEVTECDVVLSTFVTRDGVQPPPTWKIKPPFLQRIIGRYPIRVGTEPLALQPMTAATEQDVQALVDILLMPQRRLPTVLVSQEVRSGDALVDPKALQKRLLGTARVVHITPDASFKLSDALHNKRLSCYDGGVRIYWPGFKLDDDEYFHRLYLKWEIRQIEKDRSLADEIFDRITTTNAIRVRPGPLLQKLRTARERQREQALQARLAEVGARDPGAAEDKAVYDELLTEAAEVTQELIDDRDRLTGVIDEREAEIKTLRRQLWNMREAITAGPQAADGTVMQLSARARKEYDDNGARQRTFDRLLKRLRNPTVRDQQVARCPGGGFVYPRGNSDVRVFFEVKDGVVFVCSLFPYHQDDLAPAYLELRNEGFSISDFDGFEPWSDPE